MSEKKFTCVLGDDCHIINNNVDDLTYYLQDGNDVVLIINLINGLVEENEQLRKELNKYKIVILQFVGLLAENGIMESSVKEEVDELLEELKEGMTDE